MSDFLLVIIGCSCAGVLVGRFNPKWWESFALGALVAVLVLS